MWSSVRQNLGKLHKFQKNLEDKIQGKIIAAKVLSGSAEIEEWVDRLDRILDFGEENQASEQRYKTQPAATKSCCGL